MKNRLIPNVLRIDTVIDNLIEYFVSYYGNAVKMVLIGAVSSICDVLIDA